MIPNPLKRQELPLTKNFFDKYHSRLAIIRAILIYNGLSLLERVTQKGVLHSEESGREQYVTTPVQAFGESRVLAAAGKGRAVPQYFLGEASRGEGRGTERE